MRKTRVRRERPPGGDFEISEWCSFRRISVSMFYRLDSQGKAPATVYTGRRRTITAEADRAWVQYTGPTLARGIGLLYRRSAGASVKPIAAASITMKSVVAFLM
jgi:hypothetical protein